MAEGSIGMNLTFPIYNADGTSFQGLALKKSTFESVVMSLGDKITGDVYYPSNTLAVTMREYITYQGVKYLLVNPPTIVREGMVADNSGLSGMTKYSFEFYHPMYMLGNFPFSDVAVSNDQKRYLSENKTFAWIGYMADYVAKINKNLEGTEWICVIGDTVPQEELTKLSEVLSFDKNTIAEALKKGYETWEVPYVIDTIASGEQYYAQDKRFLIRFGLPSNEIYAIDSNGNLTTTPYVFRFGQGVGLKNNSRTPRNNKIITRLSGYGSEDNVPFGYPQIVWEGDQSWDYTVNNSFSNNGSYPIYDGIVGGQKVRLIKHPFTRNHLMPSIYVETVNKKVNPLADGYNPDIELVDYYDADDTYENPINPVSPSYEIHEFEKIKPELGARDIIDAYPYNAQEDSEDYATFSSFMQDLMMRISSTNIGTERAALQALQANMPTGNAYSTSGTDVDYEFEINVSVDAYYSYVRFTSSNMNFTGTVLRSNVVPSADWNDTMDDDGNYVQSYFKITLPQLDFDLYACAAVTQEMKINMRGGACLGCTFPVQVDWDDYKKNFYDEDGNFAPNGSQRDLTKYPNSENGQITVIVQKEIETFGTLMPNIYQQPHAGDAFVILGISLPTVYITNAEQRLDADMKQYMRDNNVYYFDYPLKFDEYFLANNTGILRQMKNNVIVRFEYAGETHALYIKQMSVKFGDKPLPQYDITLTDDVEIVLNQIGHVSEEVSNLRLLLGGGGVGEGSNANDRRYLRKDVDDTAVGLIRLIKGLQVGERFVTGLLGEGGIFRVDDDGTTYIEADKLYIRMRAYFDTVEVKHYLHSGGNRIASKAGINCTRVEYIDANGNVTSNTSNAVKFRCYFKASDNDKEITNDFVVGDQAYCKETNVDVDDVDMHGYWRLVVGKDNAINSNNEHYIDLSNKATETLTISGTQYSHAGYETDSDIPIAQDDIIQLGNINDTTRQGAIVEFVGGEDAPSYQIFQGINDFSLTGKNYISMGYSSQTGRAYMNVAGDFRFGAQTDNGGSYIKYNQQTHEMEIKADVRFMSPYTQQETSLEAFAAAVKSETDDLQSQIDGAIETWFYAYAPTLSNAPASTWTDNTTKTNHLGDLFYDTTTGYGYRFANTGTSANPVFQWLRITDTDVVKALADAAAAQDTADHKRRVFLTTPTPPYDEGDLWVNATYPASGSNIGTTFNNDVARCNTAKEEGESFSISDWQLASKYTDDSRINSFVNEILNGTGASGNDKTVADAIRAVNAAVNNNLTTITGGLVLTTMIALRNGNTTWSGISGAYDASAYGGGIAAWYGGGMVDRYDSSTGTFGATGAKSLFRFDGSGYVANGSIAWDATGLTNVNVSSISASTISVGGKGVATQEWVGQNYISIAYFDRLFRAYNGTTLVSHNDTTSTIDNIKAMFGFWTEQYISALGQGSGGGSGVGDVTWDLLASSSDTRPIALSHLTGALSGYATQSWVNSRIAGMSTSLAGLSDVNVSGVTSGQYLKFNGQEWVPDTPSGGGGTVTAVKVGTTTYNPTSGVVSLPAYPTTLPASDVYSWAKASTKPSYSLDEISDGSTRKLANYLPLSGGTLTGELVLTTSSTSVTSILKCKGGEWFDQNFNLNLAASSGSWNLFNNSRGEIITAIRSSGNVGIGVAQPSQKLHVSGNIYATGGVTCLSDIREKNILGQTRITVEQIARMRSIVYRWKDNGDDHDEHVGSIAQDWQSVLPQAVLTAKDEKKTLSMQYGVAALVSAITIARKVVNHEERIKELEKENQRLRTELEQIRLSA